MSVTGVPDKEERKNETEEISIEIIIENIPKQIKKPSQNSSITRAKTINTILITPKQGILKLTVTKTKKS